MRRGIIGALLLTVLLCTGFFSSRSMTRSFAPMEALLEQASQSARAGSWEQAQTLTDQAQQQWNSRWKATAVFADHGPMEQIDALFARLEVYGSSRAATAYAALCADLQRQLASLGDAHSLTWWNLL